MKITRVEGISYLMNQSRREAGQMLYNMTGGGVHEKSKKQKNKSTRKEFKEYCKQYC